MMAAAFGELLLVKTIVSFAQSEEGAVFDLNMTIPQLWSAQLSASTPMRSWLW
jgi:hypothetical protein